FWPRKRCRVQLRLEGTIDRAASIYTTSSWWVCWRAGSTSSTSESCPHHSHTGLSTISTSLAGFKSRARTIRPSTTDSSSDLELARFPALKFSTSTTLHSQESFPRGKDARGTRQL